MANCASCGKELKTTESVCESCNLTLEKYEIQLETIAKPYSGKKSKKCPHCNELFSPVNLRLVFYPENGIWYKPKKPVLSCPLCFKYIKSKYNFSMALLSLIIVFVGITSIKYFGLYGLLLLVPIFICFWVVGIKQKNDLNEFEVRHV